MSSTRFDKRGEWGASRGERLDRATPEGASVYETTGLGKSSAEQFSVYLFCIFNGRNLRASRACALVELLKHIGRKEFPHHVVPNTDLPCYAQEPV